MRLPHRWTDRLRTATMAALVVAAATATRPMIVAAQGMGGGQGGGGRMMAALFDGITLTDAERKSIDSVAPTISRRSSRRGPPATARRCGT